ncbi:hypothetical protein HOC13_00615 [Candidatus Woesearchaeota archaeon]|jgi:Icc-related predicted phosphoesterase|nr:hypothetical protein [Candidatus Woesearchaeota archaeon]
MALLKEVIILGDTEFGAGNLTDDFISDNTLSELIRELAKRKHPVDLVFNGDTFDFLKCPYKEKDQFIYPRHITAEISLNKLKLIHTAHPKIFNALKKFSEKKRNRLFFNIGNHDPDLVYKRVQRRIKKILGNSKEIHFRQTYHYNGIYVEHGQQYDILTKMNFRRLFLNYQGKQILNLSFVSFGLISRFMHLKEKDPFLERIFPRSLLLSLQKKTIKKITLHTVSYFFKSIFYYPFRYYFDPTYKLPRELFREFYRRLRKIHFDIDKIVHIFKIKRRRLLKKEKIFVLGHVHEKYVEDKKGRVIIHPGSWRDEYDLDPVDLTLIPRPKRYVKILVNEEGTDYQLIDIFVKRSIFKLSHIVGNELECLKKAAQEEGYKPIYY